MRHQVPAEALSQHVAIVGKTGSGKTYTAKGIVEQLLEAGRRICILDPTGAWWGLRTAADGKRPGFPVMIFGGDHADVPIGSHAGEAVGRLIAEQNIPAVIDLSETMLGERQRFVQHFAETVYRLNRTPLHLVIDEADEFAPQNPLPDTRQMLGAIDRIVRRGRIKGFRVVMISQRPAVIHKNVLTQANTLVAMRLTSPQDRKAVEEWIKGQADEAEGREVLSSLAKLGLGEGWVWAPEQGILKRGKFPRISTFDSSATPTDDACAGPPMMLAEVDVSGIRAALEAAVSEAEANDPARLRARISELERELATSAPQITEGDLRASGLAGFHRGVEHVKKIVSASLNDAERVGGTPGTQPELHIGPMEIRFHPAPERVVSEPKPVRGLSCTMNGTSSGLTGPQRRVLDSIAWWQSIGVSAPSRAQVGFLAGIKPNAGHFTNTVGPLKSGGLVDYPSPGNIAATEAGLAIAERPVSHPTMRHYHAAILAILKSGPQRRMLEQIIAAGRGAELTREKLGQLTGIKPDAGHFTNTVGPLRTLGLVDYPRPNFIRGTDLLFPRGLR